MASETLMRPISEGASVCSGFAFSSEDFTDAGIPVVKIKNVNNRLVDLTDTEFFPTAKVTDKHSKFFLKDRDVLIAMTGQGSVGRVGRVRLGSNKKVLLNQRVGKFATIPDKLDLDYLFYVISTPRYEQILFNAGSGSGQPNLSPQTICSVEIPFPPLIEQKAIAAILGALDDKIELNHRMNATLEAMARTLFQSWFVDFDPVRAKLDGRQPAGLDPATAALFPNEFEDSQLGPIPHGWEVCTLANKIKLLSGGTPKTSEPDYWAGGIPWYSVKDAPSETDVWVIETEKNVTALGIENSAADVLPERTTIISARGTVGKLALVGIPMAMNQSCYGVRGIKGYGDFFTYFALRQATADLQQRTHGTVFDTITRQTFETLDCIMPPPNLTQAFDRTAGPLLGQIRANLHQSRTLVFLRDTLLPKLLSGAMGIPA
jgi:type I restriction enzyme, S subunit